MAWNRASQHEAKGRTRRGVRRAARAGCVLGACLMCAMLFGCEQAMREQPYYRPLRASTFYPDGTSARPLVPETVHRNAPLRDYAFETGREEPPLGQLPAGREPADIARPEDFIDEFPFPVTEEVVRHGQVQFKIFCVVCHDPLGEGFGKIVERGYVRPPSFQQGRSRGIGVPLREAPVGYLVYVMAKGYGAMPVYSDLVAADDRWAIAAYLRALQLSQRAPLDELPEELQQRFATDHAGEGDAP